jgi:LPXTG-site transpeptidase (sortase) family protein
LVIAEPQIDVVEDEFTPTTSKEMPAPAPAKPESGRGDALRTLGHGVTLFAALCGGLFLFITVGTALMHHRAQVSLRHRFTDLAANYELPPQFALGSGGNKIGAAKTTPIGTPVALLQISRIGVDEVVVEGTTGPTLLDGPGHLRNTPLPGQYGNAVIIGRRLAGGAPFLHLDQLKPGDKIRLTTAFGRVEYDVTGVGDVGANETKMFGTLLTKHGKTRNSLTLVTSDPPLVASQRLVVQADMAPGSKPHDFTPQLVRVGADELGLSGMSGIWLPLLLWLELLLAVSLATVWLFKKWNRWCAWVVCVPTLVCVVWLVFEQFFKALPASL